MLSIGYQPVPLFGYHEKMRFLGAILLVGSLAFADDCPTNYRRLRLEAQLVRALQGLTNPIPPPKAASASDVAARQKAIEALLVQAGVETSHVAPAAAGVESALDYYAGTKATYLTEGGTTKLLYEIQRVTPRTFHGDQAIFHPETQKLIDRMSAIGVKVYIDPTLEFTGAAGVYWNGKKAIMIRPRESYRTLVHEATHAEFDHYQVAAFAVLAKVMIDRGEDPSPYLKQSPFDGFGEARLRDVLQMVKQGYPVNSINEALAVKGELASLKGLSYVKALVTLSVIGSKQYAAAHRINDLVQLAGTRSLTSPEATTLGGALAFNLLPWTLIFQGKPDAALASFRYAWNTNPLATTGLVATIGTPIAIGWYPQLVTYPFGQIVAFFSDGSVFHWNDDKKKKAAE